MDFAPSPCRPTGAPSRHESRSLVQSLQFINSVHWCQNSVSAGKRCNKNMSQLHYIFATPCCTHVLLAIISRFLWLFLNPSPHSADQVTFVPWTASQHRLKQLKVPQKLGTRWQTLSNYAAEYTASGYVSSPTLTDNAGPQEAEGTQVTEMPGLRAFSSFPSSLWKMVHRIIHCANYMTLGIWVVCLPLHYFKRIRTICKTVSYCITCTRCNRALLLHCVFFFFNLILSHAFASYSAL